MYTRVQPEDEVHPSTLLTDDSTVACTAYLICDNVTPPSARGVFHDSVTVLLVIERTETSPGLEGRVAFPVIIRDEGDEKAP